MGEIWRKELEQPSFVSGIMTRNFEMHGHTNAKMNAKSHGVNPIVQGNMSMIEGLILILTV